MSQPASVTLAQALDMVTTTPEGAEIFVRYLINLFGDASELGISFEAAAQQIAGSSTAHETTP